jgi:hypothetical protein
MKLCWPVFCSPWFAINASSRPQGVNPDRLALAKTVLTASNVAFSSHLVFFSASDYENQIVFPADRARLCTFKTASV